MSQGAVPQEYLESLADDDEIGVLLVDDNEQWARFLSGELEGRTAQMQVTVAANANEAMLVLGERESIDCVVADYRMPEVDGLQLLERVREEWPQLPFVLVTAEGSEDVASAAIDGGVTDYIVKDPGTEQVPLFASRIASAVEQYRLRRALEESERRYRSVTERSLDAILILTDGEVAFCNHRFARLVGEPRNSLRGADFVEDVVHAGDREAVRDVVTAWHGGMKREQLDDVRIVTVGGEVRHCEYVGRAITYGSDPGALVSIRDVTERKRRERELQWERALNRTVQEVVVESRTRTELEAAIADQLHDHGYALAWVVESTDAGLLTRVVRGTDTTYVDERHFPTDGDGHDGEPTVWAARTGDQQFVQDFEELFETPWRDAALDHGYRSGAALPLVHNDVSYGVLTVYHEEPNRFDETEQQLLARLADTVAYAIHSIETDRALASDHVLEATLEVSGPGYYLTELLAEATANRGDTEVTVRGTVPHADGNLVQYLELHDVSAESMIDAATAFEAVQAMTVIGEDDASSLQVVLGGSTPEADLASLGAVVRSTSVTPTRARLRVELAGKADLRAVVESLEEAYGSASMLSCVEIERDGASAIDARTVDTGALTDKQAAALEAAFHHGYFEQPRRSSATDVAESLGVTHSTYLQHLRAAQRKVFESLLG